MTYMDSVLEFVHDFPQEVMRIMTLHFSSANSMRLFPLEPLSQAWLDHNFFGATVILNV